MGGKGEILGLISIVYDDVLPLGIESWTIDYKSGVVSGTCMTPAHGNLLFYSSTLLVITNLREDETFRA
jgi:hypothetical protein